MLTNLALVDWVALVAAALLLAATLAAAVVALWISRNRRRNEAKPETQLEVPEDRPLIRGTRPQPDVPQRHDAKAAIDIRSAEPAVIRPATQPKIVSRTTMVSTPASPVEAPVTPQLDEQSTLLAERAELLLERSAEQAELEERAAAPPVAPITRTFRPTGESVRKPGFFDDPMGRHDQRYWDGVRWTEYVKVDGRRTVDPL